MKSLLQFRALALVMVGLLAVCPRAGAQAGFGLSVSNSANSIMVSNSLTYSIYVTNLNGFSLADARVTNLLSAAFQLVSVGRTQGSFTNSGNIVVFDLGQFPNFGTAFLTLTVEPLATGLLTNTVTVASANTTNTASTNVIVQVTNIVIQADLHLMFSKLLKTISAFPGLYPSIGLNESKMLLSCAYVTGWISKT